MYNGADISSVLGECTASTLGLIVTVYYGSVQQVLWGR